MDLQTEYTQRHKINFITPTPDSYLLFKSENRLFVALFAHRPRIHYLCHNCLSGNLAIEISQISELGFSIIHHDHMSPEQDVVKKIKEFNTFKSKNIEIIRFAGEDNMLAALCKAISQEEGNTNEIILNSFRKKNGLINSLKTFMNTITFRKQPLLFDVIEDT